MRHAGWGGVRKGVAGTGQGKRAKQNVTKVAKQTAGQ